jgi:hypothetical protein
MKRRRRNPTKFIDYGSTNTEQRKCSLNSPFSSNNQSKNLWENRSDVKISNYNV